MNASATPLPETRPALSAADQAVIGNALVAAASEMGAKLIRSAHSPIVREASDCATALLDAGGGVVAQAELIPLQLGSISHTFGPCAEIRPPSELSEDDFYITNHPYAGGQHIPDVFIYTPIFIDGELLAFSASVAHHIDLGGGAPGLNPEASDVHQEGILFPPSCYSRTRDWEGGNFERLVRANVRMPDATIGDINAQFAANSIGAARIRELCQRFGKDKVRLAMAALQDYSERRMRAALEQVPDGVYQGEDWLDDDGAGSGPICVAARVTVEGSSIAVDFTGTGDQVGTNINNPFASTVGATAACIKSVLTAPDIPYNAGCDRVISVHAPYGSILNPRPPAPVRARLIPSYRAYNAVMKALAHAAPERVIAGGFDTTMSCCLSHLEDGRYNIYLEIFGGGYGAGKGNDGCDAVDSPLSNCSNIPIEAMDMTYPFFRVADYSLREGSGGAGANRGGHGFQRVYEVLSDDVTFATYADRFELAPMPLFGGAPGRTAEVLVERGGEQIRLASKQSFKLRKGDRLVMRTGGGAGYGEPTRRASNRILVDEQDGLTAIRAAMD
jgi:N-methylhydantoinase B